jgi:AcrR family transcriptional regulator
MRYLNGPSGTEAMADLGEKPQADASDDRGEEALSPRSHKARRQQARHRILAAAYRVVANGGFDELTLAGVGEAAGYSRALPAHYFGSKEELIAALADEILIEHQTYIAHMSTGEGGFESLLSSVRRTLEQPLGEPEAIRAFHAFMGAALTKPVLADVARRINADTLTGLVKMIRHGQKRREICADIDAGFEAQAIFGSLRGVIGLWLVDPDAFPLAEVIDTYVGQLRRALSA